ncbi:RcpC/CpaB family pilus assembly protein [Vibrio astriarenae]|uniref:RcpC/CpaB family pilus assembly protein n=1 Tax=Vibrio astriarenae TaxID=1481923 RepID=UPI0037366457
MRRFLILSIVLVAIILGVFGVNDKLKNMSPDEVDESPLTQNISIDYVTMWRSNRNLSRGESLTPNVVEKVQLPQDEAITYGTKEDVILSFSPDTLLNVNVSKGKYLIPEFQTSPGEQGYVDLLVSENMALFTLEINRNKIIEDYIRPGTYIDILTVSSSRENLANSGNRSKSFKGVKASIFLQNIKVISISGLESSGRDSDRKNTSDVNGFISIVVEIEPDIVADLALAQRTMHLEVYRSQSYTKPIYAEVRNVIDNYTGIEEFRGNEIKPKEVM